MKKDDKRESDVEKQSKLVEPTPESRPFHPLIWQLMLIIGVFIYGSYTIILHLTEVNGKIPFSSLSAIFIIETCKFLTSFGMFIPEVKKNGFSFPSYEQWLPFSVPAFLYFINNNLSVQMQTEMDPATYQVLGNLKILSTAFLYRLIIKRPISPMQWVSLLFLLAAGVCNSYGGLQSKPEENSAGVIHITIKGLVMVFCYCMISGMGGVYSEYILKKKYETSLHLQNMMLYTFGMLLNALVWFYAGMTSSEPEALNLFNGYSLLTWLYIATQVFSGLLFSVIFKYGNNITRLFLISCAMVVTTVLSMLIFGLKLNYYFSSSFCLVIIALYLYHRN